MDYRGWVQGYSPEPRGVLEMQGIRRPLLPPQATSFYRRVAGADFLTKSSINRLVGSSFMASR